ncbi:EGF-like repeat and discoidin I-like domain-containing protein 3, partial [Stylophora pistillata]
MDDDSAVTDPIEETLDNCYSNAVGVSDPSIILDSFMTATSHYQRDSWNDQPANGRLNGTKSDGWCAGKKDKDQWLQVDLRKVFKVCAVATQGDITGNDWVIDFKLAHSKSYEDGWPTYRDANGSEVTFHREGGSHAISQHPLEVPVYARYIRFLPVTWERSICLRVEIYGTTVHPCTSNPCRNGGSCVEKADNSYLCECHGAYTGENCKKACNDPLGMEAYTIRNWQLSASTKFNSTHGPRNGRLNFEGDDYNTGGWIADVHDTNQWFEIDLFNYSTKVTQVATQGRANYPQWVTSYKLQYGDDGVNFEYYKEQGNAVDKEFAGNSDRNTVVSHHLSVPIAARYIRFRPLTWNENGIGLRVELYGCQECGKPLGMENFAISDGSISASSQYSSYHGPKLGRLNYEEGNGGWRAGTNENSWLQIDLGQLFTKVTGVATQGRHSTIFPHQVTKYKLQYSVDGVSFQYYREEGEHTDKEFDGNADQDTVVYHGLRPPITARFIRFRPKAWSGAVALRAELYGCI